MENNIIVIEKCDYCSNIKCPYVPHEYYPYQTCQKTRMELNKIKKQLHLYAGTVRELRRILIPML
jgi:hypothetical protein